MCLPMCCRPIDQGLSKKSDQRIWWKKTEKYKIRHFAHTYASEPEEVEKEFFLKNMPFDFDWRMAFEINFSWSCVLIKRTISASVLFNWLISLRFGRPLFLSMDGQWKESKEYIALWLQCVPLKGRLEGQKDGDHPAIQEMKYGLLTWVYRKVFHFRSKGRSCRKTTNFNYIAFSPISLQVAQTKQF